MADVNHWEVVGFTVVGDEYQALLKRRCRPAPSEGARVGFDRVERLT